MCVGERMLSVGKEVWYQDQNELMSDRMSMPLDSGSRRCSGRTMMAECRRA